jgi:hexosaminidase
VKVQWQQSDEVQQIMRELGLQDEAELQSDFIARMDRFLAEHGRRLIGWDEILEGGLAPGATVMSWRGEAGGIAAAKAGHDVVMAPHTHTYLDYYQGAPAEEPLAIGGLITLERIYGYEPIPASLTAEEARHVLGAQAQLWSEYIPNYKHMQYMAFPRAVAMAEVTWSPRQRRDYNDFLKRLRPHLDRLDALDVNYRPL